MLDAVSGILMHQGRCMARGWESKSVEAQQAEAAQETATPRRRLSRAEAQVVQEREALSLQRKQLVEQLDRATNPRHRASLEAGLVYLDERLEKLKAPLSTDV